MAEENEDDGKVTFKSTDVFSDSVTSRHFSYGEYRLDEATAMRLQKAGKGSIQKEEKKAAASASTSTTSEKSNQKTTTANQKVAAKKGESATGSNKSLKDDETLQKESEQNQSNGEGSEGSEGSESGGDITEQVNSTSLSGIHNQGSESTNEVNGAKETELPEKMPNRDELMKLGVDTVEKIETLGEKGLTDLKLSKAKVTKIGLFLSEMKEKNEQK